MKCRIELNISEIVALMALSALPALNFNGNDSDWLFFNDKVILSNDFI